jgi:undecaprenyl diphosphate synthase
MIGRLDRLPGPLQALIRQVEHGSRDGQRLTIRIAIDYSARDSIVRSARMLAGKGSFTRDEMARLIGAPASGDCRASPADAEVDLLIRTGGEKRLSDFMLWEAAYAELIFSDVLWPDFGPEHLRAALAEFHRRNRRFGGIGPSAEKAHFDQKAANEEARDPH